MEIRVARLDVYPLDDPTGYVVGFRISLNNNSFYRDTVIPFVENEDRSDAIIVKEAWTKIKDDVLAEVEIIKNRSQTIGKAIILPDGELEEDEPITEVEDDIEENVEEAE